MRSVLRSVLRSMLRSALLAGLLMGLGSPALVRPGVALGNAYDQVEQAYSQTGAIPPCRFSAGQLEAALRETPNYDVEYFGDFTSAVHTVLSQQAAGRCDSHRTRRLLAGSVSLGPGPGGNLSLPGSPTSATSSGVPLPLLLALLILATGGGLGGVLWLGGRRGWDPLWAQRLRHAWEEAEYRVAGMWRR